MRFQLPQFIETETKLVGPFTLKQFAWIAIGAAIIYVSFLIFSLSFVFFVIAIPVLIIALSLAFIKVDGTPLFNYLLFVFNYSIGTKRYLFRKKDDKINLPINQ